MKNVRCLFQALTNIFLLLFRSLAVFSFCPWWEFCHTAQAALTRISDTSVCLDATSSPGTLGPKKTP